jgi:hypothetical protein
VSDWLATQITAISHLFQNPVALISVLVIFGILYRRQQRAFKKSTRNAARAQYAGLNQNALQGTRSHDTGIGTQTALILRPVGSNLRSIFRAFFFFGGGAAVIGFVALTDPDKRTVKTAVAFVICVVFVGLCLWVMLAQLTRIEVFADRIVHRRFLRRPRCFLISEIVDVEKIGKTILGMGVKLVFRDGQRLSLTTSYAGYREALEALSSAHPKIADFELLADATKALLKLEK